MARRDAGPPQAEAVTYSVRTSVGIHIPRMLRGAGIDPGIFARKYGFDLSLFENPDNAVPYDEFSYFLVECARETGCECFGLALGIQARLNVLGALGGEMAKAPNLGSALLNAVRHLAKQDRGLVMALQDCGEDVELRHITIDPRVVRGEQMSDVSTAFAFSIIRELCGPQWRPTQVSLARRAPLDARPYKVAFGCPIAFNQPAAGLRFAKRWLVAPVGPSSTLTVTAGELQSTALAEQVIAQCVRNLLSHATCKVTKIAQDMALTRRTLHRRLAQQGHTFEELMEQARFSVALRLLRDTDLKLTEIALAIGYSELSAFTRAFRSWAGIPPRSFSRRSETAAN
ncbi:AraC family transcriptional regulator [Bradyrhizobium sp. Arg314]